MTVRLVVLLRGRGECKKSHSSDSSENQESFTPIPKPEWPQENYSTEANWLALAN